MQEIIKTTLLGLLFGTFGTTIGGIIGITFNKTSNKLLSFVLAFASGLMTSIVCFELIPEAMQISEFQNIILGIIFGIVTMILCDIIVQKKISIKSKKSTNSLLKTGIIVSVGLAIHNLPEGLAIGSGFEASIKLGYSLALAIAMHDVPEGISMALPMKVGGMKASKILIYVILSGITTAIGAFFGSIIGTISQKIIAICLAFAAGAMLYIVSGELMPEANKLYSGKISTLGNIAGFIIGIVVSKI